MSGTMEWKALPPAWQIDKLDPSTAKSHFPTYCQMVEISATYYNVWEYIDGTEKEPVKAPGEDDGAFKEKHQKWKTGNSKAFMMLVSTLSTEAMQSVQHLLQGSMVAADLWKAVKSTFQLKQADSITLQRELINRRMKPDETVVQFHTDVLRILREWKNIRKEHYTFTDEFDWVFTNIHPRFHNAMSIMRDVDGLNSMTLRERLAQEERHLNNMDAMETEASFANNTRTIKAKDTHKEKVRCSHCNKPGHKVGDCWTKYPDRKPEWAKQREEWVKSAKKRDESDDEESGEARQANRTVSFAFLGISGSEDINSPDGLFLWDTGAQHHISYDHRDFISIEPSPIKNISTGIPGTSAPVEGQGDIKLAVLDPKTNQPNGNFLTLKNALYSPSFGAKVVAHTPFDKGGCRTVTQNGRMTILDRRNQTVAQAQLARQGTHLYQMLVRPEHERTHGYSASMGKSSSGGNQGGSPNSALNPSGRKSQIVKRNVNSTHSNQLPNTTTIAVSLEGESAARFLDSHPTPSFRLEPGASDTPHGAASISLSRNETRESSDGSRLEGENGQKILMDRREVANMNRGITDVISFKEIGRTMFSSSGSKRTSGTDSLEMSSVTNGIVETQEGVLTGILHFPDTEDPGIDARLKTGTEVPE